MRIFADHCVHTDLVEAIRRTGIKVERALEVGLSRATDEEIFKYALKTSQVLLTFDKDFGNIIRFPIRTAKGVVIVYTEELSKDVIIKRTVDFFTRIKPRVLKGTLFIIEAKGIRAWPKKHKE